MVSPTALLLRRDDAIDALFLGKLQFQRATYFGAGPDHFLKLLAMLRHDRFGYVAEPLCTFGSHAESITTDALGSASSKVALKRSYREVWVFYRMLKVAKRLWPLFRYTKPTDLVGRIVKQLRGKNRTPGAELS